MRLKKLLTLSLAAIMGLSLVACGGNSDESKEKKHIRLLLIQHSHRLNSKTKMERE